MLIDKVKKIEKPDKTLLEKLEDKYILERERGVIVSGLEISTTDKQLQILPVLCH